MPAGQVLVHERRPASADAPWQQAEAVRPAPLRLAVTHDLSSLEQEWRRFEQGADCTVFQSFDWLAAWQEHVGTLAGVEPAIVIGCRDDRRPLFILPLATRRAGLVKQLTFLGRDLCDYNAPLLAPEFGSAVGDGFAALWSDIRTLVRQSSPYDVIILDKMPERIGGQPNPFLQLDVRANLSSAWLTALSGDWQSFYAARRSPATRRRDSTKRRRLADNGEVRLVTAEQPEDVAATLEELIRQKQRSFARMGVADIFARPGYREFFFDLASRARTRKLAHVSRLQVGNTPAAVNLGLEFRGGYYHLLASHDDGPLSRFGPGAAHLHDLMSRALERGFSFFDFTIGDEPYKRDWSDTEIRLYDHVAAATARGWLAAAAAAGTRRSKRAIKQSPLWPWLVRLRSRLGALKTLVRGRV
jgi:CelD/BcsL family acetyltransferase involved in cellulose biosynthesis